MNRRVFLASAIVFAAGPAEAQRGKLPRIGILHSGSSQEDPALQREPFERGLRELRWIPGSNVFMDYRYAEQNAALLPELAADLVRSGADVIVARGPAAIRAARAASDAVPIVMSVGADDPVAGGLAKSLSRPGGNVTGISAPVWDLDAKRLELLKEALPGAKRVAVIANPNVDPQRYAQHTQALLASANVLKLQLQIFEIKRADEIAAVLATIDRGKFDALLARADPQVMDANPREITAIVANQRLPAMYPWRFWAQAGGLMSYAANLPVAHHRSASYVDKILKGAKPQDLPIEQPSHFELVINFRTLKAMGITIPRDMLQRADELIQ